MAMKNKANYSDNIEITEHIIAEARANLKNTNEELIRAINQWNNNYSSIKQLSQLDNIDKG